MNRLSLLSRCAAFVAFAGMLTVLAVSQEAFSQEAAQKAPEPYAPGLGDFMTAYVQPHHIKLWLAGRAGNWRLAEYEAKELEETFEDIVTYQGTWNDMPIGKMVEAGVSKPLDAVEEAIKAKNAERFRTAYRQLTTACTSCHQATHNEFLVITVPSGASAFPDQKFAPR
jgi:hypothetical protein